MTEAPPPSALGQQGGEVRAEGVAPRGKPEISPHPGRIGPHLWFRNPFKHLHLRQLGDRNGDPPGQNRPALCGNQKHAGRSLIGWGSRVKPQQPGDNRVPTLDQKSLRTSLPTTTLGRNGDSPEQTPRTVWERQSD